MDLKHCSLRKSDLMKKPNSFEIESPGRVIVIWAETEVSLKGWIFDLNKVVGKFVFPGYFFRCGERVMWMVAGNGLLLEPSPRQRTPRFKQEAPKFCGGWVYGQAQTSRGMFSRSLASVSTSEERVPKECRIACGHQRLRASTEP